MSHATGMKTKLVLAVYVATWSILLIAAMWWLTAFLLGTLGDPLAAQEQPAVGPATFDSVVALTEKKVVRYLGEWEFLEPKLPGHFHHIGRWYQQDTSNFCITCHGAIPHSRSPKVRAFLNMHNLFMSCQVCHVREVEGEALTQFGWADLAQGDRCGNPEMAEGVWGEYGAKIIPLIGSEGKKQPLNMREEKVFADRFRKNMEELNDSEKVKGNKHIHRLCSETPSQCQDCHTAERAFLPYTDLGYTEERATFLVSAEVADLVARYETFHIPNLLKTDAPDPNKP